MRNNNGYGSVVCLDKTGKKRRKPWAVRITIGWSDDGKQITKYLGYYEKQKDAQLALAQYHLNGLDYEINTVTFKDIFNLWKKKRGDTLTDKNLESYINCFNHLSVLHKRKFKDIKSAHLQDALDSIDLKYATLSKTKSLMNQMYNVAMENDLALKNYATFVQVKKQQEEVGEVFTREEITHLWNLSGKNEDVDNVLLFIYLGTRADEALHIATEHIHLEENYIEVHGTKTRSAKRIVPIHPDIIPFLKERANQKWLFQSNGNRLQYRTFLYRFEKLMKSLQFKHIPHDTRKSFITYLYEAGVPMETIQFMVGHARKGVTADVYLKLDKFIGLFNQEIIKLKLK